MMVMEQQVSLKHLNISAMLQQGHTPENGFLQSPL
jgi:hypothetical protein